MGRPCFETFQDGLAAMTLPAMKMQQFLIAVGAMAAVIAVSNFLVQFPVHAAIGSLNLADLLT